MHNTSNTSSWHKDCFYDIIIYLFTMNFVSGKTQLTFIDIMLLFCNRIIKEKGEFLGVIWEHENGSVTRYMLAFLVYLYFMVINYVWDCSNYKWINQKSSFQDVKTLVNEYGLCRGRWSKRWCKERQIALGFELDCVQFALYQRNLHPNMTFPKRNGFIMFIVIWVLVPYHNKMSP